MEFARFGTTTWCDPVEVSHDPADLESGCWAVVLDFEGALTAIRFARRDEGGDPPGDHTRWPAVTGWSSSLGRSAYVAGVQEIRSRIASGSVYQVNLTTMLQAPLPEDARLPDLAAVLARGNPAPFAGVVHVPSAGVDLVTASPERYLTRVGDRLQSSPIKGTAPTAEQMLAKDFAENVMIVDLVRNDLQHVCEPGSVVVQRLCAPEEHPGLVHLVSDVAGNLRAGTTWSDVLAASFPPGSVSGAPKSSALTTIADLEPVPRGPYCGAVGWIDAEHPAGPRGELAVGIRTFYATVDPDGVRRLRFGTGAGITWASDPEGEWAECELKAQTLIGLASGRVGT
ncbi:chloride transporter [Janibacter sp. Soil728]|uniref:chorismate-binding protein n=1 Tax=Janibacter sp. Soil728 TaxID=1736393 RepID=UPI0006FCB463|nr:chorismate-binding protein [Janibacter sp. Soil728]KRE36919.1 chloride transporter [Janibacter sp. Soil728]